MTLSDWQRRNSEALAIALATFALYLHCAGPTLVPYRDAGEMATTVTKLGVLHAPGYPLYTLIAHLFSRLPLGNPAFRLNVFSAACLGGAWFFLYRLGRSLWGPATAAVTVLWGAISYQFWTHALVSEMYTLHLLILSAVLYLLHTRRWWLAGLIFGLGLGARMDLLLCMPAGMILLLADPEPGNRKERLLGAAGFFLAGLTVFLYLLIRANTQPHLNWGDPSTLERFWASLTRRSYGGTLDLLSKSYALGENFASEFVLYVKHCLRDFTWLIIPLAGGGLWRLWRTDRRWFWAVLMGWSITGPLFIFLGNLPPNTHAVAIMEAAYLVPDLFLVIAIGFGLSALTDWRSVSSIVLIALAMLGIARAALLRPFVSQRNNWVAADFARNVFYTVPEPSLVIAHSDVPIFSLFYGYWVYPKFEWRVPVAQGLAGSAWYPVMMARQVPRLELSALRTAADWETVQKANPGFSLFGTPDVEWPDELYSRVVPAGLLMHYLPRGKRSVESSDTLLQDFYIYRNRARCDAYRDFFTPELIEEYAKAWFEWGRLLARSRQDAEAIAAFRRALVIKPDMPYAAFQIAFIMFSQNKWPEADRYYRWSSDNFEKLRQQAVAWKSFAPVRAGINRDAAQALAHWGVVRERLGKPAEAERLYQRALTIDPGSADARYNLAVIYWRAQAWPEVVEQLQALSAAHPEDPRWRIYLPGALAHLKGK
jgi:hypothetical protein